MGKTTSRNVDILLMKGRYSISEAHRSFGFGEFPKDWLQIDSLHFPAAGASWIRDLSSFRAGWHCNLGLAAANRRLTDKLCPWTHEELRQIGLPEKNNGCLNLKLGRGMDNQAQKLLSQAYL